MKALWQTMTAKEKVCWWTHRIVNKGFHRTNWHVRWLVSANKYFFSVWFEGYERHKADRDGR
jgi:hypothetical protein